MTNTAERLILVFLAAGLLLLLPLAAICQTQIETKGTIYKSEILRDGKTIATISFFREGTTEIRFDSNLRPVLKDNKGKVIAGFEIVAVDPKVAKPTQVYLYNYKEEGRNKTLTMEHDVAKAEYRNGKYRLVDADATVLTSFLAGEEQLSVVFKSIVSQGAPGGHTVNLLTLASPEGEQFVFSMDPRSTMQCQLSAQKGDIIKYLKKNREAMMPKSKYMHAANELLPILQSAGILAALLFTGWQFFRHMKDARKQRFLEVGKRYDDFIRQSLTLEDPPVGYLESEIDRFKSWGGNKKELLFYDLLFSLCESAYVLYQKKFKYQWEG